MTKKAKGAEAAEDVFALDTGRIERLRFDQLAVSPLNVRKDAEISADDELVHSIRAHGLLQPLIGYLAKSGPAMVLICAGQRRLLALAHIAAPETMIPVRIIDEQTAIEVSLAENLERKAMNPADELAAFKALIDTGTYDGNRIADRFGYDRRYVRRRLKMAVLHPDILDALRSGAIGVSSAEAYAANGDAELQLKVFKEQSRPNAWNAHEPRTILQGYACAGLAAESGVGKFIGGVEAYEGAGGSCAHDDDFSGLFGVSNAYSGPRLTDPTIVRQLLERAQAAAQDQVEALARDKFPFVGAVDWCDADGNSPKPKKGSDIVLLQVGWDQATGEHRHADDIAELGAKVAEGGGQVIAIAQVGHAGEPAIRRDALLVSKATLEKVAPKSKARGSTGSAMSDEDRAELDRERKVVEQMEKMYAHSLIGETPGFGTTGVRYDRYSGHLQITLIRLEPKGEDIDFSDDWSPRIKAELLEPFREAAVAKVAKLAEAAERAKAEANQQRTDFDAKLAELEAKPIEEWPAVAVVTVDDADLVIRRMDGDEPVLRLEDEQEDPWENFDPTMVVEVIRDQLGDDSTVSIVTYDTVEAYEAEHGSAAREEEAADA